MLEPGDHDLVAGPEIAGAQAVGHQTDGCGGIAGEDDLGRIAGVEEARHLFARALVALGRTRAQPVDATMDVGVLGLVAMADGVDDRARLLGAGRAIEERQALAVHLARQDREVGAHALEIVGRRVRGGCCRNGTGSDGHARCSTAADIQLPIRRSKTARTARFEMLSSVSPTNASTSMRRASAWPMPRARR